jgi:alkylation response protein AidB-like acyl-CoA dehydrogenase
VTLRGAGGMSLDASAAEHLIVLAAGSDDSLGVYLVDPDGVDRRAVPTIDQTRRFATVQFDGAPASRLDDGDGTEDAVRRAIASTTIALAAEMVGGAQRCVDMTIAYAKQREQFGVPIGSFQAIKHRLADLSVLVDAARETVYLGAELQEAGCSTPTLSHVASAAKTAASDVYDTATSETIQLHGGIGFTWEHDAHLFFKRSRVGAAMFGTAHDHRARLGWTAIG